MSEQGIATGTLQNPLLGEQHVITSSFGPRWGRHHNGTDFGAQQGTPIGAADGGTVVFTGDAGAFGRTVVIRHETQQGPALTYYAHLQTIGVALGDRVAQGEDIGTVGNTGQSTGPHLHFELRDENEPFSRGGFAGGRALDPEQYLGRSYVESLTLREGDRGADVTSLQTQLLELGYLTPEGVDGIFGPKTEDAVKAFQRAQGLEIDGIVGPNTRGTLQQELGAPERSPAVAPEPQPRPERQPGIATAIETDGEFAAVSRSELVSLRTQGEGTSLGALTQEQAYDTARAVFGDSYGTRALIALDRAYGPDGGDGTLVLRELALGLHEGRLEFGRENRDPASGYNFGTFQIGGADSTRAESQARYNRLVDRGIANYEELTGESVDRGQLTPADRDIFSHIGHLEERSTFRAFYGNETGIFQDLADPALDGAQLQRFMSRTVQGGILAIGESVDRWTDPANGLRVDLEAVGQRASEPEAIRREPAAPVINPGLAADYSPAVAEAQRILQIAGYDEYLGTSGPNRDGVDGILGPKTVGGIQAFQRANGLEPDGIIGEETWNALLQAARSREVTVAASTAPTATAPGAPARSPLPAENDPSSGRGSELTAGDRGRQQTVGGTAEEPVRPVPVPAPSAEEPSHSRAIQDQAPVQEIEGSDFKRLWSASRAVLHEAMERIGEPRIAFPLPSGTRVIVAGDPETQTIAIAREDGTPISSQHVENGQLASTIDDPESATEFVEYVEAVLERQAAAEREAAGSALE